MAEDKIIERMKKLLALSANNSNEHEAMAAAKALHMLLAKHNISIEDVQGEDEKEVGKNAIITKCRPWKRRVAKSIAHLYFCNFYYAQSSHRKGYSNYYFVGNDVNRSFAKHIYNMVIKTIERASRKQSRERYGKEVCEFVNSFWSGAAITIEQRCSEMLEDAKSGEMVDEDGKNLPALISVYEKAEIEIEGYYKKIGLELVTSPNRLQTHNNAGYHGGVKEGKKVPLNHTVHSNNAPKMIGSN